MTKILLVEDDKSLREIYGVRLLAEGYDIVSADNGEEALAVAIKERPQLIITDVMMPKISGFDMLDILRSTTETRDIKVIMMTALGSEENRERSERLGADRYLVKSQVGIEDVVRAVHDLLGDQAPAPAAPAAPGMPGATPGASLPPAVPLPAMPAANAPASTVGRGLVSAPAVAAPGMPANQAMPAPASPVDPLSPDPTAADSPSRRARIIQPINDPTRSVDLQALVDKELAKEGSEPPATTDEAREVVESQLDDFANQPVPMPAPSASSDTPATDTIAISSDGTLNDTTSTSTPATADTTPATPPSLPPVAAPAATPPAAPAPATPSPTPPAPVVPPVAPAPSAPTPPPAAPSVPPVATMPPPAAPSAPTPPAAPPAPPTPPVA